MKTYKIIILLTIILSPIHAAAQGLPLSRHYSATSYGGSPQNWDVEIDSTGIVYFSHNWGISTFDGKSWEHFTNANQSHIRSLSIDHTGKLYAGGYAEFGYFEANKQGKLEYTQLTNRLTDTTIAMEDIWSIAHNKHLVMFTSGENVFLYDHDSIKPIKSGIRFGRVYNAFDNIFLYSQTEGILQYIDNEWHLLPETQRFTNESFLIISEFTGGQILIATEKSGIWKYNIKKSKSQGNSKLLKRLNIDFETKLPNNKLYNLEYDRVRNLAYVGTIMEIYVIDTLGRTKNIIYHQDGIVNKQIISLKCDRLGNLWIGGGNGVAYVHTASPLTILDNRLGITDNPYDASFDDKHLYVTNTNGLFTSTIEDLFSIPPKPMTHMLNDPNGGWAIYDTPERTLVSMGYNIVEVINSKTTKKLIDIEAYSISDFSKEKQILFIGCTQTSHFFDLKKNILSKPIDNLIGATVNSIYINEQHIVGETMYKGVFNMFTNIENEQVIEVIDQTFGLPSDSIGSVVKIDSIVYICTSTGLYQIVFKPNNSIDTVIKAPSFVKFSELNKGVRLIEKDTLHNGYWLVLKDKVIFVKNVNNKPCKVQKTPYKIIPTPYKISQFQDLLMILTTHGIFFYDSGKIPIDTIKYQTIIRKVIFGKQEEYGGYSNINFNYNRITIDKPIDYEHNNLKVSFVAPYHFYQDSIEYECMLKNIEEEWEHLKNKTEREYINLPPGKYVFKVRATNVYGQKSEVAELVFTIKTPWYKMLVFKILYILSGIFVLIGIITFYTYRLKLANQRLERTVQERTHELQEQTKNVIIQNEEIRTKNKLLIEQAQKIETTSRQNLQLVAAIQQTEIGILIMKYPNKVYFVNQGFRAMLGIESNIDKENINISNVFKQILYLSQYLYDTFRTSETRIFETQATTMYKQTKWLHITITPISEDGKFKDDIVILCTDISNQKTAKDAILRQKEELQIQGELLRNVNAELAKSNQLINSSISHAKRIQVATLPSIKTIMQAFSNTFVIFKPRDVVSGDFYWFNKIGSSYMIIVADCTGHGVPGALMSMIGNTLINEMYLRKDVQTPSQVLTYLNDGIKTLLRHKGNLDVPLDDGMDISVCLYTPDTNKLQIAMANQTALLFKKDETNIINGDFISVGDSLTQLANISYTNQEFTISKGDRLYLYTDGFQDQLGGEKYTKYGSTRFLRLMEKINSINFDEQAGLILNEHEHWRDKRRQTDDILIWGIKF